MDVSGDGHEEAIETFKSVTGADDADARASLQAAGWDLNTAVNRYLEPEDQPMTGPASGVPEPVGGGHSAAIMDLDEEAPHGGGSHPLPPFEPIGHLPSFAPHARSIGASRPDPFMVPLVAAPPVVRTGSYFDAELEEEEEAAAAAAASNMRGGSAALFKEPGGWEPGRFDAPNGRGAPRVSHPQEVLDIPIEFRGDEGGNAGLGGSSRPAIQELPRGGAWEEAAVVGGSSHAPARVILPESDEEDEEGAAGNGQKEEEDGDDEAEEIGRSSIPSAVRRHARDPVGQALLPAQARYREPSAPVAPSAPGWGGEGDERAAEAPRDDDIDEQMLRAAIEASRREAEERHAQPADVAQPGPHEGVGAAQHGEDGEDDDVARALALSIQTAGREAAARRGAEVASDEPMDEGMEPLLAPGPEPQEEEEEEGGGHRSRHPPGGTAFPSEWMHHPGGGAGLGGGEGDRVLAAPAFEDDDVDADGEPEDAPPLVRRRVVPRRAAVRRSPPPPSSPPDGPPGGAAIEEGARPGGGGGTAPIVIEDNDPGSSGAALGFPREVSMNGELAGISPEEREEAAMYEAAMFGVPYVPPARAPGLAHSPPGELRHPFDPLPRPPFGAVSGIAAGRMPPGMDFGIYGHDEMEGPAAGRAGEPPSAAVVEQRLLREQQDGEYLLSLAADREKELRLQQEKESAEEVRVEEERQRIEGELAAERLAEQLATKRAQLPPEPGPQDEAAVTLLARMPDGTRLSRRFSRSDKLQAFFDFIDVSGKEAPGTYRLIRQYPRRALEDGDHGASLEGLGLTSKQEAFFVELF